MTAVEQVLVFVEEARGVTEFRGKVFNVSFVCGGVYLLFELFDQLDRDCVTIKTFGNKNSLNCKKKNDIYISTITYRKIYDNFFREKFKKNNNLRI